MTVIDSLKHAVSRPTLADTPSMETPQELPTAEIRALRPALLSVDRQFEIADAVKEQAEAEYIDEQILKNMSDNRAPDFLDNADELDPAEFTSNTASARILEIQTKQETCKGIHSAIQQGTKLLEGLAERTSHLTAYLEKAEIEISHLEGVESHSSKLKVAASNLTTKYHEMKATIEEQKQQIALLETHKFSSRETIETARLESARITEEKEELKTSIELQKAASVKLQNDKQVLNEKIDVLERRNSDLATDEVDFLQKIDDLEKANLQKDKELAKCRSKLADMDQSIERHRIDLADVRAKYENVNASLISNKTKLDETLFLLESSRREYDEKVCRKEKRNAELDAQNKVLLRQVTLNEDVIAELDYKLNSLGVSGASDIKGAADEAPKTGIVSG